MNKSSRVLVTALAIAFGPWVVVPAAAAPIGLPLMLQQKVGSSAETIQYRRGRHGGYHGGAGIGLGIAGALIGGAMIGAATQPYVYNGYPPGYYGPGYNVAPPYDPGYAIRNGFVCQPGTVFRGEDGRNHLCQ
ncbi:hypothetical protein [Rhodopseudomonas sp. P2A-2r]|uniref:hypothetical protein n=1 Tax=unclassified Rhodopseudomonas TaxID=2638247 RepID=UPI0022345325|nr:hypothetical protein [Rhodopseudomonas sp. P2A-2r]UZE51560.1 hypothetical protein ONR75_13745 [Rhodopseudomonas sp. P2A-2r]